MEGGLLEEFGTDAKTKIMLSEEYDEAIVMDAVIEKYVRYFKSILHRNTYYFWKFVLCEVLNFVILFANFYITDVFLNGKFWYYGWDVLQYGRLPADEQKFKVNPFCATFPLEVSCTVPNVGAAGGEQHHNGLCVLSQNVINEKMYLVIWFWLAFMIIITPLCIIYRLCTIFFDGFRSSVLMSKLKIYSYKNSKAHYQQQTVNNSACATADSKQSARATADYVNKSLPIIAINDIIFISN